MKKLLWLVLVLLLLAWGCADNLNPVTLPPPEEENQDENFYEWLPQGPFPCEE